MSKPDWEKEGLLEGLDDDDAREARVDLLDQLHDADVELDELKTAVEEDRLALLPVERVIGGEPEYTPRAIAEKVGLDVDLLRAQWQALGLPRPGDDERVLGERDLAAARQLKDFIDAGLPEEGILGVARVMGEGMSRTAEAVLDMAGQAFLKPGDSERDLGLRYAEAAKQLIPIMEEQLDYVFNLHMREGIRADVVGATERATGKIPGSREVGVCFADLVDFTKLGENLPPEEIGGVAGELADMAADVAQSPVKLVKTIGDAAMLVAPDAAALLEAALLLVDAANAEGESFPRLRAGLATGLALHRAGDFYGAPVNLASRITDIARPGSVVVDEATRRAIGDDARWRWSTLSPRRLKGVDGSVQLFRARPALETATLRR